MRTRLKDIARDLGVSLITVSKALRGAEDISEQTRQRVLKRVKELNYRPNMLARGLACGKTYIVGLVVPDLIHPFFSEFAKALNAVLRPAGYGLILASSEEDPVIEQQEVKTILARAVDALLIASCQLELKSFFGLDDSRTPLILIDRNFPYLNTNFVGTDDFQAGLMATRHLLQIGRTRIAHIAGPQLSPGRDRFLGYQKALSEYNAFLPGDYVISNSKVEEAGEVAGYSAMYRLLLNQPRVDGVFCYNDLTAIGAIQATVDAGLSVPEDVAFVGCGNFRYSAYLRIPLSSVDQAVARTGEAAGRLTLELMRDYSIEPRQIRVEPKLVVRASSMASRL